MTWIKHPSNRSSRLTLWLGSLGAVVVAAVSFYFIQARAEKKMSGKISYLKPVPSDSVLRTQLNKEQYNVMREGGTEASFHNQYYDSQRPGS
jgi:cytochrome c-type biogenesis protein CcmH/NrfF